MSSESTTLAKRMQAAREDAGLSRAEIAEMVLATEAAVRLWETAQREPRTKYLRRWADATDKHLSWFFEGDEVAA